MADSEGSVNSPAESNEMDEVDEVELDDVSGDESEEDNGFLDLEAVESGDDDSDEDDVDGDDDDEPREEVFFTQFSRLPIELRQRVWEYFDPDLRAEARVFDFLVVRKGGMDAWQSATLEYQTAPARTLLSLHRETRAMALKYYPDTFFFRQRRAQIRYRSDRDIIMFQTPLSELVELGYRAEKLGRLLKGVQHVAFEDDLPLSESADDLQAFLFSSGTSLRGASSLTDIYLSKDGLNYSSQALRWCVTESAHSFYVEALDKDTRTGEDLQFLYCWPKPEDFRDDEGDDVPQVRILKRTEDEDDDETFQVWPLTKFMFERGVARYDRIKEAELRGELDDLEDDDAEESDLGSDIGDYESDGIDDGSIDEDQESIEDDLNIVPLSPDDDDDADSAGAAFGGFSPLRDVSEDPTAKDGPAVGQFSSLEPESPNGQEQVSGDGSDEEPVRAAKRSRRRVVASDSEDEEDEEPSSKRARTSNRPGRAVLSDSGEDEIRVALSPIPSRQRNRRVVDDDEDEEDEEEDEDEEDEEDDDEEEEDDEDEDEQPKKPKSLAERLRLFRSENPVNASDSEDDPDGEMQSNAEDSENEYDEEGGDGEQLDDGIMLGDPEESAEEDEW